MTWHDMTWRDKNELVDQINQVLAFTGKRVSTNPSYIVHQRKIRIDHLPLHIDLDVEFG